MLYSINICSRNNNSQIIIQHYFIIHYELIIQHEFIIIDDLCYTSSQVHNYPHVRTCAYNLADTQSVMMTDRRVRDTYSPRKEIQHCC